ncbi:glycosyl transferase family 2 [Thalassospira xiamenensis]|uniref:glycosyltransferase family 2 protein n=1 Tax=Thalassospira xiamenensis TaxID=220697 RepID=UPI000DED981C|nr:glycosyltransferase family 2 protein [Thalassospira xiamenensis]RCK35482.1 glycosyl transferase family 2 [Thalassospira xiamenensis]
MQPDVSFVLPVYNKASALPYFFASLLAQTGDVSFEVVFVDDVSTDNSLEILNEYATSHDFVRVIDNEVNAGPSIRLNQGVQEAKGKYLALFDCDEILAPDAIETMLSLAKKHQADMVHGRGRKTATPIEKIEAESIGDNFNITIHDDPLARILGRGMVRMTWLVTRELFHKAGGCDEAVFVQDESLALRLAFKAQCIVDADIVVTMVPDMGSHISHNTLQLNHDRFLVYLNFLQAHPELPSGVRLKLYQKCISAIKKARRDGAPLALVPILTRYIMGKLELVDPVPESLMSYRNIFGQLPNVRRIEEK